MINKGTHHKEICESRENLDPRYGNRGIIYHHARWHHQYGFTAFEKWMVISMGHPDQFVHEVGVGSTSFVKKIKNCPYWCALCNADRIKFDAHTRSWSCATFHINVARLGGGCKFPKSTSVTDISMCVSLFGSKHKGYSQLAHIVWHTPWIHHIRWFHSKFFPMSCPEMQHRIKSISLPPPVRIELFFFLEHLHRDVGAICTNESDLTWSRSSRDGSTTWTDEFTLLRVRDLKNRTEILKPKN